GFGSILIGSPANLTAISSSTIALANPLQNDGTLSVNANDVSNATNADVNLTVDGMIAGSGTIRLTSGVLGANAILTANGGFDSSERTIDSVGTAGARIIGGADFTYAG
ncbi:unnamed protein product, partial [Phaeothamnion confervicola]